MTHIRPGKTGPIAREEEEEVVTAFADRNPAEITRIVGIITSWSRVRVQGLLADLKHMVAGVQPALGRLAPPGEFANGGVVARVQTLLDGAARATTVISHTGNVRFSTIALLADPSDCAAARRYSAFARVCATLTCSANAFTKRGCLVACPPMDRRRGESTMVVDGSLRVSFFPEEEALATAPLWWSIDGGEKYVARLAAMMRAYNPAHCVVVVVIHPETGAFAPAYQLRDRDVVSATSLLAETFVLFALAHEGDLTEPAACLASRRALIKHVAKNLHEYYDAREGIRPGNTSVACDLCQTPVVKPRLCGGCGRCYCSRKCQKDDWPQHKGPCRASRAKIDELVAEFAAAREALLALD